MEIFDIVDDLGNPTGETISRREAHEQGICHRTAHVWVVREKDGRTQVLLQKRAAGKDSFPGCFDTSSAGHIPAGSQPLNSALRELSEELGIAAQAEDLTFIGTFRIRYEKEFYGKLFRDNEVSFVYLYRGAVDEAGLYLQEEEVESVAWFDLDEVVRLRKNNDPSICVPTGGLNTLRFYLNGQELHDAFDFRDIAPDEGEEAAEIEALVFPPNEACSRDMMLRRVKACPELFLVAVDRETGVIAGFLNGIATKEHAFRDEFFKDETTHDPAGDSVMLLGLDVREEYRMRGLAREIVRTFAARERAKGRRRLVLTCLPHLVKMYEGFGFTDLGWSASVWGGEAWHEMEMIL